MFSKLKQAINLIQHQQKSEKDIDNISDALKLFDYFDVIRFNIDFEDKLRQCARLLKYKSYSLGETIFLEGDRGQHFFLIFSGKVSILVHKSSDEIQQEKELLDTIKQTNVSIEQGNIPVQEIAKKEQLRAKAELNHRFQYDTMQHLLSLGNNDLKNNINSEKILTVKQVCELKHTKTFGECKFFKFLSYAYAFETEKYIIFELHFNWEKGMVQVNQKAFKHQNTSQFSCWGV